MRQSSSETRERPTAAPPRLTHPPLAAPPGAEFFTAADGTPLYTSAMGTADRGAVWFVSGAEAQAEPPDPKLAAALRDAGFCTIVFHPRGTGFSAGLRGDSDNYDLFLGDHHRFLQHLMTRFARVFLIGQSAGCAFALEAAVKAPRAVTGIVLSNPAWRLRRARGMTPSLGDFLRFAWNFLFHASALTVDMNSNPAAVEFEPDRSEALAMGRDPLVVRYFSMRYLTAQAKVMRRIPQNLARIAVPVLLVQGAHDGLVEPASMDVLLAKAGSADKRKLLAPDGGHGSSAVETQVAPIVAWFVAHSPQPSSAQ